MKNMKQIKPVVERLLTMYPELRDNDNKLIVMVWREQDRNLKNQHTSALYLQQKLAYGKLANPETIRRVRQKLQEDVPKLRGKKYYERHGKAHEIRKAIATKTF